jgi:hypothetical protein
MYEAATRFGREKTRYVIAPLSLSLARFASKSSRGSPLLIKPYDVHEIHHGPSIATKDKRCVLSRCSAIELDTHTSKETIRSTTGPSGLKSWHQGQSAHLDLERLQGHFHHVQLRLPYINIQRISHACLFCSVLFCSVLPRDMSVRQRVSHREHSLVMYDASTRDGQ